MKKLLAILLALAVVGGAAFAQITFSGYERGYTKVAESGATFANRLRLNMSFKDADGNFGFWGRLQAADSAAPTVAYAYGWAKVANIVKITAGKLGNYDYTYGSGVSDYALGNVSNDGYKYDSVFGTLLQVTPIDGLTVGTSYIPASTLDLDDFGFDVKYALKDVGEVVVESAIGTDAASTHYTASVNFTMVKDLGIVVGYKHDAGDASSAYAILDYAMGDLSVQVAPEYAFSGNLYVEGYVRYASGNFAINVLGAYDQAGDTLGVAAKPASYALSSSTGLVTTTAATAAVPSNYFAAVECYYTVGKTVLMTGFTYDQGKSWSIPFIVRANF